MIAVENWGLISYSEALTRQEEALDLISRELKRETLVICTHPPVVTLGRATKEGDVFSWKGETHSVSRGGRATYHGPSQVVMYPLIDLNRHGRDLHKFMRLLEEAILETLVSFGIENAVGRSLQKEDGSDEPVEATGVWIGSRKIASIGIAVRRWITFHGLALNVENDPAAFQGMKPCGFAPGSTISMEEVLGSKPSRETVESRLEVAILKRLNSL